MTKQIKNKDHPDKGERPPHQVRLPGFVSDGEVGLGDVVKRATSYVGIRSCGGCEQRRVALNRWMTFSKGRRR